MSLLVLHGFVAAAAPVVVQHALDEQDGSPPISLREAIAAAPPDGIVFDATAFPVGMRTEIAIDPALGPLPDVLWGVDIDGDRRVTLRGTTGTGHGLRVLGNQVIRGLEILDFPGHGIVIQSPAIGTTTIGDPDPLFGNFIANADQSGIMIAGMAELATVNVLYNTVGQTEAGVIWGTCKEPATGLPCGGIVVDSFAQPNAGASIEGNAVTLTYGDPAVSQGVGVLIAGGGGHLVQDNRITNSYGRGIEVVGSSISGVQILDNTVITGQSVGIGLGPGSASATVQGNQIGVDGLLARGNASHGIHIFGSSNHLIRDNTIAYNERSGIRMGGGSGGAWHGDSTIQGNGIGVRSDGAAAGNEQWGIYSTGGGGGYLIGGHQPGEGNTVANNARGGIWLLDHDHVVTGNRVGVSPDGTQPMPNSTDGGYAAIRAGGDGILIGGEAPGVLPDLGSANQVGANGGKGITSVGYANRILGNLVGVDELGACDATQPFGTDEAGIAVFGGSAVDVVDNVVSNSGAGNQTPAPGILLAPELDDLADPTVSGNTVGLELCGNSGNGIELVGGAFAHGSDNVVGNVISNNGDNGIYVENGVGPYIFGNTVGDGPNHGNQDVGIKIVASKNVGVVENRVAGNGSSGVVIDGSKDAMSYGISIVGNLILPSQPGWPGNGGHGLAIRGDRNQDMRIHEVWVFDNHIAGNAERGIRLNGRAVQKVTLSQNLIWDNGECAIDLDGNANDNASAPTIDDYVAGWLTGSLEDDGIPVDRVEVYADPGQGSVGEASVYLGDATILDPMSWEILVPGYVREDLRALVTFTDGSSSGLTRTCGDGCPSGGLNECLEDGNDCTENFCDPVLGCQVIDRPDGFRCFDGDPTTGTMADPDHCESGVCTAGGTLTPADCPWSTPCNTAVVDPNNGCVYEQYCYPAQSSGICSPDDLDDNANGTDGDACDPCGDCVGLLDSDGDGVLDTWEVDGVDTNCDGTFDLSLSGNESDRDVYLELDYMAVDCLDPNSHSHQLTSAQLQELEEAFLRSGLVLRIDHDGCIPHETVTGFVPPGDPDCGSWAPLYDLKAEHFTPERRGIYHYGVIAHAKSTRKGRIADGVCTGRREGGAPKRSDEFLVAKQRDSTSESSPVPWHVLESQKSSVLHELGHSLGLNHGGHNGNNRKPNYQSTMNYRYEFDLHADIGTGYLDGANAIDFSRELMEPDTLQETVLYEDDGLGSSHGDYMVSWDCDRDGDGKTDGVPGFGPANGPLDWNCDGGPDGPGISTAANIQGKDGNELGTLEGSVDIDNMYFSFQCVEGGKFNSDTDPGEDEPERRLSVAPIDLAISPSVELDVVPGCTANPVQLDGQGTVSVVVYSTGWVVEDLVASTAEFQGAPAAAATAADEDGDGLLDVRFAFPADRLFLNANSIEGTLGVELDSGRMLLGKGPLTPTPTWEDADGDGVSDTCDQCPGSGPGTSVDDQGCP